jgi:hypothetical protein
MNSRSNRWALLTQLPEHEHFAAQSERALDYDRVTANHTSSPTVVLGSPTVATVGRANLRQVREYTKELVAKFINDYLAANPKQPVPAQKDRGSEAKPG